MCLEELQNKRLRLLIHLALSQELEKEDPAHAQAVVLALVQCRTTEAAIFAHELSKAASAVIGCDTAVPFVSKASKHALLDN